MFDPWPGGQARPLPLDYEQRWSGLLASLGLVRHGWWASHEAGTALPRQGWKIHVSAIPSTAETVLSAVHDQALRLGFSYKVVSSLQDYMDQSGAMGAAYSQKGKFITIYPVDYRDFLAIVAAVGSVLRGAEHYTVPFEPNIPGTPLYYRYGCIDSRSNRIVAPSGRTVPDDRTSYCPDFVTDPLRDLVAPAREAEPWDSVHQALSEDYRVEALISQRARGGNYVAVRQDDGTRVFLKEGRRLSEHDAYGLTGMSRLENERHFLHRLHAAGLKVLPPLRYVANKDHGYLVVPFLEQDDVFSLDEAGKRDIAQQMIGLVQAAHEAGVILGDVKLENFLVAGGQVYLADLETARDASWEDTVSIGSRDYLPRLAEIAGARRDRYSLAISICFLFCAAHPGRRFVRGVRIRDMLRAVPPDLRRMIKPWLRVTGRATHPRQAASGSDTRDKATSGPGHAQRPAPTARSDEPRWAA